MNSLDSASSLNAVALGASAGRTDFGHYDPASPDFVKDEPVEAGGLAFPFCFHPFLIGGGELFQRDRCDGSISQFQLHLRSVESGERSLDDATIGVRPIAKLIARQGGDGA